MKLLVWVLLFAGAFGFAQQVRRETAFMNGGEPFEIRLDIISGPGLEASLHNRSATAQTVLVNSDLQPSVLILEDTAGAAIRPFDERTREKFDRTVTAAMYSRIAPGESIPLGRSVFKRKPNGNYEFHWGPYHFRDLHPGAYRARVTLESRIDKVTARATGRSSPVSGVWKGVVSASPVEIRLP